MYKNNNTSCSSGFNPDILVGLTFFFKTMNVINIFNRREKSYNYNRHRKCIQQNSIHIHKKNSQKTKSR